MSFLSGGVLEKTAPPGVDLTISHSVYAKAALLKVWSLEEPSQHGLAKIDFSRQEYWSLQARVLESSGESSLPRN